MLENKNRDYNINNRYRILLYSIMIQIFIGLFILKAVDRFSLPVLNRTPYIYLYHVVITLINITVSILYFRHKSSRKTNMLFVLYQIVIVLTIAMQLSVLLVPSVFLFSRIRFLFEGFKITALPVMISWIVLKFTKIKKPNLDQAEVNSNQIYVLLGLVIQLEITVLILWWFAHNIMYITDSFAAGRLIKTFLMYALAIFLTLSFLIYKNKGKILFLYVKFTLISFIMFVFSFLIMFDIHNYTRLEIVPALLQGVYFILVPCVFALLLAKIYYFNLEIKSKKQSVTIK